MARIACHVHGRGRGHASRARAVLPRLRAAGHDVRVFGGGHACDVLADDPGFTEVRPCLPGPGLARSFARRFRSDWQTYDDSQPDAVVTDCDLAALHVAAARRLPTLAMGHGLIFRHTQLPEGLPWLSRWREIVNAASSSCAAHMRVPVRFAPVEPRINGTSPNFRDIVLDSHGAAACGDYRLTTDDYVTAVTSNNCHAPTEHLNLRPVGGDCAVVPGGGSPTSLGILVALVTALAARRRRAGRRPLR